MSRIAVGGREEGDLRVYSCTSPAEYRIARCAGVCQYARDVIVKGRAVS